MKIESTSFNEREIMDGCLFQRGRIRISLAPDAMRRFVRQLDDLRETFKVRRLSWCRFERTGRNKLDGSPEYKLKLDVADTEAEYEITLIGNGDMTIPGEQLTTWLATVGRLADATPRQAIKIEPLVDLFSIFPHSENERSFIIGGGIA